MNPRQVCLFGFVLALSAGLKLGLWAFFFVLAGVMLVWIIVDDPRKGPE